MLFKTKKSTNVLFAVFTNRLALQASLPLSPLRKNKDREVAVFVFAEKGGFEPPVQLPVRQFSKLLV